MAIKLGASSYSWQIPYYLGKMSLEDCIADLSKSGGTGFELIPEQMLPDDNFVKLEDGFKNQWFEWMDKYKMRPTCLDHFDDLNLYYNRTLTIQEQVESAERYLILAKELGFYCLRVLTTTPFEVLEKIIPMAEGYGIKLGLEIHAPLSMKSEWADKWCNIIAKKNTKFAGFIPDFGIFTKRPYPVLTENIVRQGANRKIVDHFINGFQEIYKARVNADQVKKFGTVLWHMSDEMLSLEEEMKKMGASPLELSLLHAPYCYDDPHWLVEFAPLVVHVHGKFYDMVDDGKGGYTDPSIDTERAVRILRDNGYDGYISSEYESPFMTMLVGGMDPLPYLEESEAIRRHQIMLRKIIQEK